MGTVTIRPNSGRSTALPLPMEPEPSSVPPDDRVGFDEHEGLAPARPEAKEDCPQKPVHCLRLESSALCPLENPQLVPESEDLQVQ
jgi:hypothetical protein